jgi:hypothetical protein
VAVAFTGNKPDQFLLRPRLLHSRLLRPRLLLVALMMGCPILLMAFIINVLTPLRTGFREHEDDDDGDTAVLDT